MYIYTSKQVYKYASMQLCTKNMGYMHGQKDGQKELNIELVHDLESKIQKEGKRPSISSLGRFPCFILYSINFLIQSKELKHYQNY